jgi:two-component system, chemotaxis family, CheB/CheR fusion protein
MSDEGPKLLRGKRLRGEAPQGLHAATLRTKGARLTTVVQRDVGREGDALTRSSSERHTQKSRVPLVVGIGASAGGLDAIRRLLESIGDRTGLSIIFLQHLQAKHETLLGTLLSSVTRLPLLTVEDGMDLLTDRVYLAPAGMTVSFRKGRFHLLPHKPKRGAPDTIDLAFKAIARCFRDRSVGIVLSGTGFDGARGLAAIKRSGGVTFAQEPTSAKFDEMPKSAAATGTVDHVLPPEQIASKLLEIAGQSSAHQHSSSDPLSAILDLLWTAHGIDFRGYKRPMILRRVLRRMRLSEIPTLEAYTKKLAEDPEAIDQLRRDLLIGVSGFFRDPEVFSALSRKILPGLFEGRPARTPIRVWVPACSTGEELYSIAILLHERLGTGADAHPLQLFGTDVSDDAIDRARAGLYSENELKGLSKDRIERYFSKTDEGYRIDPRLREVCVFAKQNVTRDPPFSKIDLISCRNLLIYLEPEVQRSVLRIFHFALAPRGVLVLGPSETTGPSSELFAPVSRKHRIYTRRATAPQPALVSAIGPAGVQASVKRALRPSPAWDVWQSPELFREADRAVMNRFVPPGLLINDRFEVVQFRGDMARFLEPRSGEASFNISKIVPDEIAIELRSAIIKAKKEHLPVRRSGLALMRGGSAQEIELEVLPLELSSSQKMFFLAFFLSASKSVPARRGEGKPNGTKRAVAASLERQLARTKEHLRVVMEDQEATNEELKVAMEEVTSSNEELQSINEELETAKEELQSSNEEMTTMNEELQTRNAELGQLNSDMMNLLSSVEIPIVMLGPDLRIRRFTEPARALLNLIASDVGRPLTDLRINLDITQLEDVIREVIDRGTWIERETRDAAGRWFSLRIRPYVDARGKSDGVVLAFIDVTDRKRTEEVLTESLVRLDQAFRTLRAGAWTWDLESGQILWDEHLPQILGVSREDFDGSLSAFEALVHPDDLDRVRAARPLVLGPSNELDLEYRIRRQDGEERSVAEKVRTYPDPNGRAAKMVGVVVDVTERKKLEAIRQEIDARLAQTQKLESLGVLAGGIAHDFNNLLVPVTCGIELAREEAGPGSSIEAALAPAQIASERLTELSRQMLLYAGRGDLAVERIDLSRTIEELRRLLQSVVKKSAELSFELSPRLPEIEAEPTQVRQVIVNLVSNASEALTETGGRIRVRTSVETLSSEERSHLVLGRDLPKGELVVLEVSDDGAGFDEDTAKKIFDPFFSTKLPGRGLGLSVVHGVLHRHGAGLSISSAPGRGATFRVFMKPAGPPIRASHSDVPRKVEWRGRGKILLADDEDLVRSTMKRLLEHLGFEVVEADDGVSALAKYDTLGGGFDVAVLDLMMPRMSGAATLAALRSRSPRMPVLLMSGRAPAEQAPTDEITSFLEKPASIAALAEELRRILHQ